MKRTDDALPSHPNRPFEYNRGQRVPEHQVTWEGLQQHENADHMFVNGANVDGSRNVINLLRSGIYEPAVNLFKRGYDTAADIVETAAQSFTNSSMLDTARNVINVFRGGIVEPSANLFKRGYDTAADIVETATQSFVMQSMLDASRRVVNVFRGGNTEPTSNLFKRGYDTAADIVETASQSFVAQSMLNAGRQVVNVFRGATTEPVSNLFKRGVDTANDIVESSGRWFTNNGMLDASRRVINVFRGATTEPVGNLFKRGVDTAADIVESAGRWFTNNSMLDAARNVIKVYRNATTEPVGNLFKRGVDTMADVLDGGGRYAAAQAGADKTSSNRALGTVVADTRSANGTAASYAVGVTEEFKQRAAIGAPGAAIYGSLTTVKPWSDSSGGVATQTFKSDEGVWKRTAPIGSTDVAEWTAWQTVWDEQNNPTKVNRSGVSQESVANLFKRGVDTASDIVESVGRWFTNNSMLDASRNIIKVFRSATNEPVSNLFKRGVDTAADIVESAGRWFTNNAMLDAGRNIIKVYRNAVGEPVGNLFKRGTDTLDDVLDSSNWRRFASAYGDSSGRPIYLYRPNDGYAVSADYLTGALGSNLLENADFEIAPVAGSGDLCAGWYQYSNDDPSLFVATWENQVSQSYSGTHDIYISTVGNKSIPANTTRTVSFTSRKLYPARPGQQLYWRMKYNTQQSVGIPAGLAASVTVWARVEYSDGTASANLSPVTHAGSVVYPYAELGGSFSVPTAASGAKVTGVRLWFCVQVQNSTAAAVSTPNGLMWDVRFDAPELAPTIPDQRLLNMVTVGNRNSIQVDAAGNPIIPLSSKGYASSSEINIAEHWLKMGWGTLHFGKASWGGLSPNVRYFVYVDDPDFDGDTGSGYQITQNESDLFANSARYYVGVITTAPLNGTSGGSGGGGCFTGDTPVGMADGTKKPIRDVQVGDMVLAMGEDEVLRPRRVTAVHQHDDVDELLDIAVRGRIVTTTPCHRFYVGPGVWMPAGELTRERGVYVKEGKSTVRWRQVQAVRRRHENVPVYNLTVEHDHTYLVDDIVVHNIKLQ